MTVTEYLNQVALLDSKIRCTERLLEEARELAYFSGGGIDYSKIQVDHSANNNQMDKIIDVADLTADYRKQLTEMHLLKRQIVERINRITDDRYHRLLVLKYIERHTLEQVSREMRYNYDYVRELHSKALKAFYKNNQDIVETPHKNPQTYTRNSDNMIE